MAEAPSAARHELATVYRRVRAATVALCAPLSPEDHVVQTMPDVSPAKWHLAHTSWFFETFVLARAGRGYQPLDARYQQLFNSYYNAVGEQHPRAQRGLLSRPSVAEIHAYRRHVDSAMHALFVDAPDGVVEPLLPIIEVGVHHEEQHQELIVTDLKHVLATNPLRPVYRADLTVAPAAVARPMRWKAIDAGVVEIGHAGGGFAFDNEGPRHRALLEGCELGDRLVTCGEYLSFMEDGGYRRPELWLSEGWDARRAHGWEAPLYWERAGAGWSVMTLGGLRAVNPAEPVCHTSYYEADAYATWAGARLPREAEWEVAAAEVWPAARAALEAKPTAGGAGLANLLERDALHPLPATEGATPWSQLFGDVWEWTASAYAPYPGYQRWKGALGEYNGKFMVNQMVLRGGSCATPQRHLRATYRNFFGPATRWQFAGIRLAR